MRVLGRAHIVNEHQTGALRVQTLHGNVQLIDDALQCRLMRDRQRCVQIGGEQGDSGTAAVATGLRIYKHNIERRRRVNKCSNVMDTRTKITTHQYRKLPCRQFSVQRFGAGIELVQVLALSNLFVLFEQCNGAFHVEFARKQELDRCCGGNWAARCLLAVGCVAVAVAADAACGAAVVAVVGQIDVVDVVHELFDCLHGFEETSMRTTMHCENAIGCGDYNFGLA